MKEELLKLIYKYVSKSEWVGYYSGLNEEDILLKHAISERDITESKLLLFLENMNE